MKTTPRECPRCRGSLQPTWRGEHRDKFLQCEYCGFLVDVPDEHTVEHSESEEFTDDHGRQVRRTRTVRHTRRDLDDEPGGAGEGGVLTFIPDFTIDGEEVEFTLDEFPPKLARMIQATLDEVGWEDSIQSPPDGGGMTGSKSTSSEYCFESMVEDAPRTVILDDWTDMPLAPRYGKLAAAAGVGAVLAIALMMLLF